MATYKAKCASCNMPLEGPADPQPESIFSCPKCGISDRLENIEREIGEYIADKVGEKIDSMFESAVRGSKNVKFIKNASPKKTYRFVVDYEPTT